MVLKVLGVRSYCGKTKGNGSTVSCAFKGRARQPRQVEKNFRRRLIRDLFTSCKEVFLQNSKIFYKLIKTYTKKEGVSLL